MMKVIFFDTVRTYTHTYMYVDVYICMHMYVCMNVYVYVNMFMHMYIHDMHVYCMYLCM